jgi:hypothetical protein
MPMRHPHDSAFVTPPRAVWTPSVPALLQADCPVISEEGLSRFVFQADDATLLAAHRGSEHLVLQTDLGGPGWPSAFADRASARLGDGSLPPHLAHTVEAAVALARYAPERLLRAALRHALVVRAGASRVDETILTRVRSLLSPHPELVLALLATAPPLRGLATAVRAVAGRPLPLATMEGVDVLATPVAVSELLARLRSASWTWDATAQRWVDLLRRDEPALRAALLDLLRAAADDRLPGAEALQRLAGLLGRDERADHAIAAVVLLRAVAERAGGPCYAAQSWPPADLLDEPPGEHDRLVVRWAGASVTASVVLDGCGRWRSHTERHGRPSDDTPLERLAVPPAIAQALVAAGIATVGDLTAVDDAALFRMRGVGRAGLLAVRRALPPADAAPVMPEPPTTLEALGRHAHATLDSAVLGRSLSRIPFVSGSVASALATRRIRTAADLLRWPAGAPIAPLTTRQWTKLTDDMRSWIKEALR